MRSIAAIVVTALVSVGFFAAVACVIGAFIALTIAVAQWLHPLVGPSGGASHAGNCALAFPSVAEVEVK